MSDSDPFTPQSTRKLSVETDRRESVRAVVTLRVHAGEGEPQKSEGTLSLDGFFVTPGNPVTEIERGTRVKLEVREDLMLEAEVQDAPGDRPGFVFLTFGELDFDDVRKLARHLDDLAYPEGRPPQG